MQNRALCNIDHRKLLCVTLLIGHATLKIEDHLKLRPYQSFSHVLYNPFLLPIYACKLLRKTHYSFELCFK